VAHYPHGYRLCLALSRLWPPCDDARKVLNERYAIKWSCPRGLTGSQQHIFAVCCLSRLLSAYSLTTGRFSQSRSAIRGCAPLIEEALECFFFGCSQEKRITMKDGLRRLVGNVFMVGFSGPIWIATFVSLWRSITFRTLSSSDATWWVACKSVN